MRVEVEEYSREGLGMALLNKRRTYGEVIFVWVAYLISCFFLTIFCGLTYMLIAWSFVRTICVNCFSSSLRL